MGHLIGKELYRKLGHKVDGLVSKAPWNDTFYEILKELYTPEEAEIIVKMPFSFSHCKRISSITGYKEERLQVVLDRLAQKGLVVDIFHKDRYYYMVSPFIVGIFEFTMMRTGTDYKKMAGLFSRYMSEAPDFYRENFQEGQVISIARAVPYPETITNENSDHVEILDYENIEKLVQSHDKFAVGICSCRHEKHHLDEKTCDIPLKNCMSFGYAADYLSRNNLADEVTIDDIMEIIESGKKAGVLFSADNVQRNIGFICSCCSCCCNILQGINKHGYLNTLLTSNYLAAINADKCNGCGICIKACPIKAIKNDTPADLTAGTEPDQGSSDNKKEKATPTLDETMCLGCGICAYKCKKEAITLNKREKKVIHPETTFHRNILSALERGNLPNLLFDNPGSINHRFMRATLGAFLKLTPVQKTLMSDTLRSSFLKVMEKGAALQGKGWLKDL